MFHLRYGIKIISNFVPVHSKLEPEEKVSFIPSSLQPSYRLCFSILFLVSVELLSVLRSSLRQTSGGNSRRIRRLPRCHAVDYRGRRHGGSSHGPYWFSYSAI